MPQSLSPTYRHTNAMEEPIFPVGPMPRTPKLFLCFSYLILFTKTIIVFGACICLYQRTLCFDMALYCCLPSFCFSLKDFL